MGFIVAAAIIVLLVIGFTRRTIVVMAVLVALFFVSVGIYLAYDAQRQRQAARLDAALVARVAFDPTCAEGRPIRMALHNTADRTLRLARFDISAYRAGHSIPLYRTRGYVAARILPPGRDWQECRPLPQAIRGTDTSALVENPPETLRWEVENLNGTFER
ncbi:hypothetical protein [Falsirhodobacter deserti]|uniref:hypothetical protein n=1 Tax=Falsirhodobacter deserti TaxID=1365611 RepID=UPI000FE33221|nr:hypothetical protein [Falsirhodobacter deserti]